MARAPPGPHDGFPAGKSRGAAIRIAHPDSGYRIHPEMFGEEPGQPSRVLRRLERDFIDDDRTAEDPRGDHGLSTASVRSAPETQGQIVGVAPASLIVPLRVTKPWLASSLRRCSLPMAPTRCAARSVCNRQHLQGAMSSRLAWAGFPNGSLHEAIVMQFGRT